MKSKFLRYLIPKIESKSESFAHKVIKYLFYNKILENNPNIIEASLEKYFETRRADVYFKFNTGQEIVVEIQNSPITSRGRLPPAQRIIIIEEYTFYGFFMGMVNV